MAVTFNPEKIFSSAIFSMPEAPSGRNEAEVMAALEDLRSGLYGVVAIPRPSSG